MKPNSKVPVATIVDASDRELMAIRKIADENGELIIRGRIFGAMPMFAKLTPSEARGV